MTFNTEFWNGQAAAAPGPYAISRSLRFNSSDSAYLSKDFGSAGNRKTWTWAGWVKKAGFSSFQTLFAAAAGSSNTTYFALSLGRSSDDPLYVSLWNVNLLVTTQVFRDPSAWYHIVLAFDATQGTNANKLKLYVNGSEVTTFATDNRSSISNQDYSVNSTTEHNIGANRGSNYLNGYLADVHFIDGQALDPTSFGFFDPNGIWQPKAYTGTYGTNGFHLDFADNSTAASLGDDTSGNNNDWTVNNISVAAGSGNDSLVDVPTNGSETDTGVGGEVRGNYCTWNPLGVCSAGAPGTAFISNGNLDFYDGTNKGFTGTIGMSSGKWYWELYWVSGTANQCFFGITNVSSSYTGRVPNSASVRDTGVLFNVNGATTNGSGTSAFSSGDYVQFAYDADNKRLFIGKNNTWLNSSDPAAGTNATYTNVVGDILYPIISDNADNSRVIAANFGQRPFAYTAPSGFKALNTANLPAPVVTKPSDVFDVKLYTGNGSTQNITGLGFSPDLVWIKGRSVGYDHRIADIVRGAGKELFSSSTVAEDTNAVNGYLSAFNSDGFTLQSGIGVNQSSATYAAWCWDAGSSTVTNTQGSITSQVRANASAGFSVVSWSCLATAGTVGHGLGVAPSFIIFKDRNATSAWFTYHKDVGAGKYLQLNSGAATVTNSIVFSTAPTSAVFNPGTAFVTGSGYTAQIAYCFAPVAGYSAFGIYTGNGSADGPFVYTGFRPRWVMLKRTDNTDNWAIIDMSRSTYNVSQHTLWPNSSAAEATSYPGGAAVVPDMDVLSNGFKLRQSSSGSNVNAATYIYAAFAESPFQYARAR